VDLESRFFVHTRVTLGGNRTYGQPTNVADGQRWVHWQKQDGATLRTPAWHADYVFPSGVAPVPTTGANKVDHYEFVREDGKFRLVNFVPDVGG
jgi:hypothetical protein